ncbi:polyketide synthase [Aureobasidium pullulans]|nr:polyketide synthase [Aureobasidium pullulans]
MTASNLDTSSSRVREATSFVFGGHIGPQTMNTLEKQVRQIVHGPNGKWILETIADMPRYWKALTQKIPKVAGTMDGAQLLADLDSWFRNGPGSVESVAPDADIPDIWTGFLMVAIQLDQYWRYLQFRLGPTVVSEKEDDIQVGLVNQQRTRDGASNRVETIGFCAGMIAAVAVASSNDRGDFEKYGSTALRIAVLMATLVEATEAWSRDLGKGGSMSLATAWRTDKQGEDMTRIVSKLSPDAYVSVIFDRSRATVTALERIAPKLIRQLRAAGVTAIPLAFKGQLHSPSAEREMHTEALIELCHTMPELQFPDAKDLALPTYLDHPDGNQVSCHEVDLVGKVLRSILVKQLNWTSTVSNLVANKNDVSIIAFGLDHPLPPSITRTFGSRQIQYEIIEDDIEKYIEQHPKLARTVLEEKTHKGVPVPASEPNKLVTESQPAVEDVVAVVGMSIRVAGARDLEGFEQMMKTGKSQHEVITRQRMTPDMLFRDNSETDRKWYGNFMDDPDAFDHKFFKKSPREAKAIDPQGRLSLEAAYQTIEQSGYFTELATTDPTEHDRRKNVGVYVGLCSYEYDVNIHCHPASAFTGTGELRSFIPGRISHFFGWTGPSLTFDTACSSSITALHMACRDVLSDQVPAALCGGVNVLTNLQWTQNLAAGSFISPTGQCKPFDSAADGYCRGDGIAYVFLKKLSVAVADGNNILGTIRSTGLNQNLNTTPLFVPNVSSLSTLFNEVIRKARVEPRDISLVEMHGTGTPVGDPAEWESIRNAVAGPLRDTVLPVGSIKGHVGHTEGASGLVSLIKVLLMMRGNFIPPQASFENMNPNIHAQETDMMRVVTSLQSWPEDEKLALINNYGACGSNSSVVIGHTAQKAVRGFSLTGEAPKLPFWIAGADRRSIASYSSVLASYLRSSTERKENQTTLADISYNMRWQSNSALPQGLIFACRTLTELQDKLVSAGEATPDTASNVGIAPIEAERPVVLCFGGQVSTSIGLDPTVYKSSTVFRRYLDECDAAARARGLESIYPDIFSHEPYVDVIKLQVALFAMQYASAKSWISCGLNGKIVSVVGHSFGEITALCVAGALSVNDTIQVIAGRAMLVQSSWGPDPGAMVAIEADEALVCDLLKKSNLEADGSASIACYNGPRSFTVAGSSKAIEVFAARCREEGDVKSKRLNVTNAFHSSLVDSIVDKLADVGKSVTFHDPVIPIERAVRDEDRMVLLDWKFVGSHMRQPVWFNQAVQRLAEKHPRAVFLEAGSNSTITIMASRALAQKPSLQPDALQFQSISITNTKKGLDRLTDATIDLWKQGIRVSFWGHHRAQKVEYKQLLLPPYQFEKSRHWLELKSPIEQAIKIAGEVAGTGNVVPSGQEELDLWTFIGFKEPKSAKETAGLAQFRINTTSDRYQRLFKSHVIAKTAPIAPATLEIDIAIETLFSLNPDWKTSRFSPVIHDMQSHSPICADSTREYYIDLERVGQAETAWSWIIYSVSQSTGDVKHAEGRITMCSPTDAATLQEFGRYERLVSYEQCQAVLGLGANADDVEALQGRSVYRAFEEVVEFGSVYQGVRYVVGRPNGESGGVVHKRHTGDTWLDVPKADSYGQVAGMYVNLLTDIPASDMFVATGLELVMRSPKMLTATDGEENGPTIWHVFARHSKQSEKSYVSDVFVFDAASGDLAEVILGLQYVRIPKATMSKILTRVTVDKGFLSRTVMGSDLPAQHNAVMGGVIGTTPKLTSTRATSEAQKANFRPTETLDNKRNLANEVGDVVASVSGLEKSQMSLDSEMADLGIDSLMGMELAREIETVFRCSLDRTEMMVATTLRDFVACVSNALRSAGKLTGGDDDINTSDDDTESDVSGGESTGSETEESVTILTPDHASDTAHGRQPSVSLSRLVRPSDINKGHADTREEKALQLVSKYIAGWQTEALEIARSGCNGTQSKHEAIVIVTGASGSLGSNIVQSLTERSDVATVVCMNRSVRNQSPMARQSNAFTSRGIALSEAAAKKLVVYGTDTSKERLGLADEDYDWLTKHATHIIHNAWPMSATRPLEGFEPQINVMRNLLDLAQEMATREVESRKIGFQFISSIGVTGCSNESRVLEQAMPMSAVVPSGYNEAKWVCERMLSETLRRYPALFRAMVARPGQISGSSVSGFWNPVEHFAFIVKSANALKSFPDLSGTLHWLPVDKCASAMVDLLDLGGSNDENGAHLVYHVDNPVGQPWTEMSAVLAAALEIDPQDIVPLKEWCARVRQSVLSPVENPASLALGFLENHFERMACGGIFLDTRNAIEHSKTIAAEGPVSPQIVRSYVSAWKAMGFLR